MSSDERTVLTVRGASPKEIREALCRAQAGVYQGNRDALGKLIAACDELRPLGSDGKHGDLHTPYCGCEDKPEPPMKSLAIRAGDMRTEDRFDVMGNEVRVLLVAKRGYDDLRVEFTSLSGTGSEAIHLSPDVGVHVRRKEDSEDRLVEEMAKAIYGGFTKVGKWETQSEGSREKLLDGARAALDVVRKLGAL